MMVIDKIKIVKSDITELQVDAIVNAANTSLLGGSGVNGAIHRAAGPKLLEECKSLGGCNTGRAKITHGHQLKAKYVIHAVGPVWRGGARGELKLLASCYSCSLKLALENKVKTLAFPSIGSGVYGYPLPYATAIAVKETANFLELHDDIKMVYFACFDDSAYEAYQQALELLDHE